MVGLLVGTALLAQSALCVVPPSPNDINKIEDCEKYLNGIDPEYYKTSSDCYHVFVRAWGQREQCLLKYLNPTAIPIEVQRPSAVPTVEVASDVSCISQSKEIGSLRNRVAQLTKLNEELLGKLKQSAEFLVSCQEKLLQVVEKCAVTSRSEKTEDEVSSGGGKTSKSRTFGWVTDLWSKIFGKK